MSDEWNLGEQTWARWALAVAVLAMAAGMSCVAGCSLIAPGADTREALAARQTTDYDAEGNFSSVESTTHERSNVVLEGDSITAEFGIDGKVKVVTGATNVMVQVSRPRDAAEAKGTLDALNAQVALETLRTVRELLPYAVRERIETRTEVETEDDAE